MPYLVPNVRWLRISRHPAKDFNVGALHDRHLRRAVDQRRRDAFDRKSSAVRGGSSSSRGHARISTCNNLSLFHLDIEAIGR